MNPSSGTLESIQIGQPRNLIAATPNDGRPREWRSAIDKQPINGPVAARQDGLEGDAQADRTHHGGIDKAILAYAAPHYDRWKEELPDLCWRAGAFGENLTIAGQDETCVCIGDRYRLGDVVVEVSQPRQPCWKLGRLWNQPDLVKRVLQSGRCGWYLRVLEPGDLLPGQSFTLIDRPLPDWTISRAHELMYGPTEDREAVEALSRLPQLSLTWREDLISRRLLS